MEFQETKLSNSNPGTVTLQMPFSSWKVEMTSLQYSFFNAMAILCHTQTSQKTFKIHLHDKVHLTDDMRMIQLRIYVKGEAERSIPGLGSTGIMYDTLAVVQPSVIVRAVVNKLAKGSRISRNNRQALKEFSLDIINCLAIMHGLHHCADVNANELLRRIVLGLPDQLIDK